MAGIKPKIVCAQCGAALTRTDTVCPSCGVAVDWTDMVIPGEPAVMHVHAEGGGRKNKSRSNIGVDAWKSKSMIGVIAAVALAIIVYTVFFEKRPGAETVQQPAVQPFNTAVQIPSDLQELENSVAAAPDDMNLTLQLADALNDRQFYERAIPSYKAYLMMNPKDANARVDMGICYKEIGNYPEAESQMKMALHYVPNHLFAHFNLGIVYLSEGNLEESNKWFKKTVALDPASEVGKRAQQLLTQHNSQPITQE